MKRKSSFEIRAAWRAGILLAATLWAIPAGGSRGTAALQPEPGRRLALVVGNNAYASSPLSACRNDARAIAGALTDVGFTVTLLEDATRQRLADALGRIAGQIRNEDVFFFYFSGHGTQVAGENFLIPVDYAGSSLEAVRMQCINAQEVEKLFGRARIKVLVLDACRTNPFGRDRAGGRGLASMDPHGSLIAFATGSDQVAQDGSSEGNSPFTEALLEEMRQPGLIVQEVFRRARKKVYEVTNGEQQPAVYDALHGDFILRPGSGPAVTPTPPTNTDLPDSNLARREELALWESIKDLKDRRVFEDYLRRYPNGKFKVAAESRLADLGRVNPPVNPPSNPSSSEGLLFGPVEPVDIGLEGPFDLLLEKTSTISDQKFLQFADLEAMGRFFEDDIFWKKGDYSITSAASGKNGILVILSKLDNPAQTYHYKADFPADEVKKDWDEGYRITEIAVIPNRWFVVLNKNSGIGGQSYKISETWPSDYIKKEWDLGRHISHARWQGGKFVVVMSEFQKRKITSQRWNKGWDEAWGKEARDQEHVISLLCPDNDKTYFVMSKYEDAYDGYRLSDQERFPAANLAQKMAEGYWVIFLY